MSEILGRAVLFMLMVLVAVVSVLGGLILRQEHRQSCYARLAAARQLFGSEPDAEAQFNHLTDELEFKFEATGPGELRLDDRRLRQNNVVEEHRISCR